MGTNVQFSNGCSQKSIKVRPKLCLENTFDKLFGHEEKKPCPPRKLTLLEREDSKEKNIGRKIIGCVPSNQFFGPGYSYPQKRAGPVRDPLGRQHTPLW